MQLTLNDTGLMFGSSVLAKYMDGELDLDEPRILSLLSVAAGKAVLPKAIAYIYCAEKYHRLGNSVMRDTALALTGVPALQKKQAERLAYAEMFLSCGHTPLELLKIARVGDILHDADANALYKYVIKFNPNHVPAGSPVGGQFTSADGAGDGITDALVEGATRPSELSDGVEVAEDDTVQSDVPAPWANPNTFEKHFEKHGSDFNATSPEEYASKANEFLEYAKQNKLPMIEYANGAEIGAYDPATNTYGLYNADGTTKTFYKPTSATYFER